MFSHREGKNGGEKKEKKKSRTERLSARPRVCGAFICRHFYVVQLDPGYIHIHIHIDMHSIRIYNI